MKTLGRGKNIGLGKKNIGLFETLVHEPVQFFWPGIRKVKDLQMKKTETAPLNERVPLVP